MPTARQVIATLAITCTYLLTSACSADPSPTQGEYSASEVCDATLEKKAAHHLESLTGANTFDVPNIVHRKQLADRLRRAPEEAKYHEFCRIYTADSNGVPAATLEFRRRSPFSGSRKKDEWITYRTGQHAHTSDDGASLYFHCPSSDAGPDDQYVKGVLWAGKREIAPDRFSTATISILNSVSRRLAQELGCAKEARLTAGTPRVES
ncbi:hypothetical protein [Streptomyces albus]|uniref:hypothetical protein n=1 Tax=Streptomyces albus TaxID=1888 RepID=UPI00131D2949|nr:hypothetical protein [Streptomyces albus]